MSFVVLLLDYEAKEDLKLTWIIVKKRFPGLPGDFYSVHAVFWKQSIFWIAWWMYLRLALIKFSISPKRVFSKYSSAFLQYLLDTIFRLAIRITQKLRALQMLLEHVSWCPHHSSKSLVGCTPPIRKRDFLYILQYYNFDRSKFYWKNFHIRFFPLH